jgi:tRNA A-37 threonylcarbamoyl transferase component Bud32
MRLPPGYELQRNEDLTYVLRQGEHETLKEMGLTDRFSIEDMLASGLRSGRGRIVVVPPPDEMPGDSLVVKQVLHGGLYGRVNPDGFRGPGRLLRELRLTVAARERGVPAPEIALAAWTHGRPCRLFLASVRVPASRSLEEWICHDRSDGRRAQALAAAARAVREMHDAGMVHGDLNLRNLMVAETERTPEGFVVDLYGSRLAARVGEAGRTRNLARLLRSAVKDERVLHRVSRGDQLRFLRAYCGGRGARFRDLARRVRRRASWFGLHRLGWALGLR